MPELRCPNCGYTSETFPGKIKLTMTANISTSINRYGNVSPSVSRRVSMSETELADNPIVHCPNCDEEYEVFDLISLRCYTCGKKLDIELEEISDHYCRSGMSLRCPDCLPLGVCRECVIREECHAYQKFLDERGER